MAEFKVGQAVEVVDDFSRPGAAGGSHVCDAEVVRLTKTLVITKNEHGNECKYRTKDGKMVGYSWPYLTHKIIAR